MLDLPIIDTHVHLWNLPQFPHPWLGSTLRLNRPFGLTKFRKQTSELPVAGMVFVEAGVAPAYALLEARWAVSLAESDPRLLGVVAAAPIDDGLQARTYLEALAALGPLVKGVRRNLQDERDPAFPVQREFVAGTRLLQAYGFSFDICIRHEQLATVTTLVRECPEVSFVLDHLGKPPIRQKQLDPWRRQLATLAGLPNVACKLSGLVTEAEWRRWQPEDLAPFVEHMLAVFGPSRVLFGSDWPILTQASTYRRWANVVDALTAQLTLDERRWLWEGNARRWYCLEPVPVKP